MIDFGNFRKSLKNLKLQNDNRKSLPPGLPQLLREAVDESVIQRFEVCYDTLWKSLRRHLIERTGTPRSHRLAAPRIPAGRRNRRVDLSGGAVDGIRELAHRNGP